MSLVKGFTRKAGVARELVGFFWSESKWWWLTPVVVLLLAFIVIFVVAQSAPLAPFIYRLF